MASDGAGTELTTYKAPWNDYYDTHTLTVVEKVTVNSGAKLTIARNEFTMKLPSTAAATPALVVDGEMLNKGTIDTDFSNVAINEDKVIYATINKNGKLVNEGKMADYTGGNPLVSATMLTAQTGFIKDWIDASGEFADDASTFSPVAGKNCVFGVYATEPVNNDAWDAATQAVTSLTHDQVTNFLFGSVEKITLRHSDGYNIDCLKSGNIVMWFNSSTSGAADRDGFYNDLKASLANVYTFKKVGDESVSTDYLSAKILFGIQENPVCGTAFDITNNGTLDLRYAADHSDSYAWGRSSEGGSATKQGKFKNEK